MVKSLKPKKINVLVTAIGGGGNGDQLLKALRLAQSDKYNIFGSDVNPNCPQFKDVKGSVVLPFANSPSYIESLLKACSEFDISMLLIGCEPELKVISAAREKFEENGILVAINPKSVIDTCMDKVATAEALKKLSFQTPRFVRIENLNDLKQVTWFPVVVKPAVGAGGSANCYIAQTPKELMALAEYIGVNDGTHSFMCQEYVGTPEEEYTVGILHDLDGNYINSIALRRELKSSLNIRLKVANRTGRDDLGPNLVISSGISHGYVGRFPEVTRQCAELTKGLGVRGAVNIQCRLVDGIIQVFEINPRFSGTSSIRAMMGYNEPDILIRKHCFDEEIQTDFPYREGMVIRSLTETIL